MTTPTPSTDEAKAPAPVPPLMPGPGLGAGCDRVVARRGGRSTTIGGSARERSRSFRPSRSRRSGTSRSPTSPGVAEPCLEIAGIPRSAYRYTAKGQPGRGGHERHRGARPRRHRPARGASRSWKARGSSSRSSPTSTCSTSRSTRDDPDELVDTVAAHRAHVRRDQPRGHQGARVLRDREAAARAPATSRCSTTTSTARRSSSAPRCSTRCEIVGKKLADVRS